MNPLFSAAVLIILSADGGLPQASRVPVLVELFTSEGCSSCPSADALLESLLRNQPVDGADIIPIGLHVDYFNHLGWKDAFSSAAFTERQEDYSQVFGSDLYTPQIIVDGREAVAGDDGDLVRRAIASASGRPHLPLRVTARVTADGARMTIELPAAPSNAEKIHLVAAITEDGLTTSVKRGQNHGRTLHHIAVARKVQRFDALTGEASVKEVPVQLGRGWGPKGLKAVIWLQGENSHEVYGAAVAPIAR
jgi:hypothetical protein